MLRLAGDVAGRRVLDVGCGSGPLSAELRAKGGIVTGADASAAMVDLARQRLGPDVDLHVADLRDPLPFVDNRFDVVVASLVLHYLAVTRYTEDYVMDGQQVDLTFWHRPLHVMTDSFAAAGFRIVTISEPAPAADTPAEILPEGLEPGTSFICFLFFVLEVV